MKLKQEFDFRRMTSLDRSVFHVRVGDKWFNNEEQRYTDSETTHFFTEQGLVLQALEHDGRIESARIDTQDTLTICYGRVEFVASLPGGVGTWPALWLLPNNDVYGSWPTSGEIDVVEHIGRRPNVLLFSLHTEEYNWQKQEYYTFEHEHTEVVNQFHTYAIDWYPDRIVFELDGEEVVTFKRGAYGRDASPKGWPFDQPFFIIMNLAMGGNLGGPIDRESLPQQMIVQSLKIYELETYDYPYED